MFEITTKIGWALNEGVKPFRFGGELNAQSKNHIYSKRDEKRLYAKVFLKLLHNQTKLGLVLFYTFSHPGWLEINFYVFTKKLLWLFGWNKEKGNTHMYISFSVELFLLLSRSLDLVWFYFTLFFFVFFLHTLY